jgi:hypothetical protein
MKNIKTLKNKLKKILENLQMHRMMNLKILKIKINLLLTKTIMK